MTAVGKEDCVETSDESASSELNGGAGIEATAVPVDGLIAVCVVTEDGEGHGWLTLSEAEEFLAELQKALTEVRGFAHPKGQPTHDLCIICGHTLPLHLPWCQPCG